MEEDIDILEDFIEDEGLYELYRTSHIDLIRKALKNLIKGYRELEEIEESFIWQSNFDMKYYEENYIPKSKIKEKIEELEKKILEYEAYRERGKETDVEYYDFIANSARKKVLQELLEDK